LIIIYTFCIEKCRKWCNCSGEA